MSCSRAKLRLEFGMHRDRQRGAGRREVEYHLLKPAAASNVGRLSRAVTPLLCGGGRTGERRQTKHNCFPSSFHAQAPPWPENLVQTLRTE